MVIAIASCIARLFNSMLLKIFLGASGMTTATYVSSLVTTMSSTIGITSTFALICLGMITMGYDLTIGNIASVFIVGILSNLFVWAIKFVLIKRFMTIMTSFINVDEYTIAYARETHNVHTQMDFWKYCLKNKTVAIICVVMNLYQSETYLELSRNLVVLASLFGLDIPTDTVFSTIQRISNIIRPVPIQQNFVQLSLLYTIVRRMIGGKGSTFDILEYVRSITTEANGLKKSMKEIDKILLEYGIVLTEESKFIKNLKDNLEDHMEGVNRYTTLMNTRPNTFLNENFYQNFLAFSNKINDLRLSFDKKSYEAFRDTSMAIEIGKLAAAILKLKSEAEQLRSINGLRPTPIGVIFFGPSGIGKSTLNSLFVKKVNKYIASKAETENLIDLKNAKKWTAWNEQSRDAYDTGCLGQEWHINDDGFMDKTQKDHAKYLAFMSCQRIGTVQAELGAKGRPYAARCVVVNTNRFFNESQTINNPEALARRFQFFVTCSLARPVPQTYQANTDHLNFKLSDGTTARNIYKVHSQNFHETMQNMDDNVPISFDEIVSQVGDAIIRNDQLYQEQMRALDDDVLESGIIIDEMDLDGSIYEEVEKILSAQDSNSILTQSTINAWNSKPKSTATKLRMKHLSGGKNIAIARSGKNLVVLSRNGKLFLSIDDKLSEEMIQVETQEDPQYSLLNRMVIYNRLGFGQFITLTSTYSNFGFNKIRAACEYFIQRDVIDKTKGLFLALIVIAFIAVTYAISKIKSSESQQRVAPVPKGSDRRDDDEMEKKTKKFYSMDRLEKKAKKFYSNDRLEKKTKKFYSNDRLESFVKQRLSGEYNLPYNQQTEKGRIETHITSHGMDRIRKRFEKEGDKTFEGLVNQGIENQDIVDTYRTSETNWKALFFYINTYFFLEINAFARGAHEMASELIKDIASILVVDINHSVSERIYRGSYSHYKIGKDFVADAFLSFSTDLEVARMFGTQVICIDGGLNNVIDTRRFTNITNLDWEEEIIVKPGTKLRATHQTVEDGCIIIHVSVVGDQLHSGFPSYLENKREHYYKPNMEDIFKEKHIVHCISADKRCSAGFAKKLKYLFDYKSLLPETLKVGTCVVVEVGGKVIYNLITKAKFSDIPRLTDISNSLEHLSKHKFETVHGPKIASGLDKQDWKEISSMIYYWIGKRFEYHAKSTGLKVNGFIGYDLDGKHCGEVEDMEGFTLNIVYDKWNTTKGPMQYIWANSSKEIRDILKQSHTDDFSIVMGTSIINFIKFTTLLDTLTNIRQNFDFPTLVWKSPLANIDLTGYEIKIQLVQKWHDAEEYLEKVSKTSKDQSFKTKVDNLMKDQKESVDIILNKTMGDINNGHLVRICDGVSHFHGIATGDYVISPAHPPASLNKHCLATNLSTGRKHNIVCVSMVQTRDLALWKITTEKEWMGHPTEFYTYKDISKQFINSKDILKQGFSYDGYAYVPSANMNYAVKFTLKEKFCFDGTPTHQLFKENLVANSILGAGLPTLAGDCGTLLFVNEPNIPHKIVGMYNIKAAGGKQSIFMLLTKEIFEELKQNLDIPPIEESHRKTNIFSVSSYGNPTLKQAILNLDKIHNFTECKIGKNNYGFRKNTRDYTGTFDDAVRTHYYLNEHHPEHGKMTEESTVEMMIDLYVSAYQITGDWKKAQELVKTWLLPDGNVSPKFMNASAKGIQRFAILVNLNGFIGLDVDVMAEKHRRKLKNSKNFINFDKTPYLKTGVNSIPSGIREIDDYMSEMNSHITLAKLI